VSLDLLIDSDVAIKLCIYRLRIWEAGQPLAVRDLATLGASKYIIPKRLKRCVLNGARETVTQSWESLSRQLSFVEPTNAELEFAATLEALAQRNATAFDTGESLLVAIMATRGADLFVSGDKRAICALPALIPHHAELANIAGNVACLEQLFIELVAAMDSKIVRNCVCAEAQVDRTLSICFQCQSGGTGNGGEQLLAGLNSYLDDLRQNSASVLCSGCRILSRPAKEDGVGRDNSGD
jgi:hypothetical protein